MFRGLCRRLRDSSSSFWCSSSASFLLALALPSLLRNQDNFLTSRNWVVAGNELSFGIAGLLWTTVLTSILAMVIAVPIAVGVALFLTQYLHKRASGPLSFVVDLLAAVPSIIFGLWGLTVLGPFLTPVGGLVDRQSRLHPAVRSRSLTVKSTVFVAGVVLAIMVLPIVTAISRDVFAQTPRDNIEAALALGATRWEMIRTAVLPYGRSGVISASMLGLGRALGETIAVMIILSHAGARDRRSPRRSSPAGRPSPARSPTTRPSSTRPSKTGAFIAAGLVLFVVTFIVNAIARIIVEKGTAKS